MALISDYETWDEWGKIDEEYAEMMERKVPRRYPMVDLSNLPLLRGAWIDNSTDDMKAMLEAAKDQVKYEEIFIPLRDGSSTRSLVFRPTETRLSDSPLIVLIHGGGFLFGTAEMEAAACIGATMTYGCVTMSLDYRLAPESKFPVAYEDCWDALQWIAQNASSLGVNLSNGFILGGTSSGGQMTATLAHWARDRKLSPPLTGIYLNAASIVHESAVPAKYKDMYRSRKQNDDSKGLSHKTTTTFEDAVEPDFTSEIWNPLNWHNGHAGLPRTYFQICGADIQRDDSLIYERVLRMEYGIDTKKFHDDTLKGLGWLLIKQT